MTASTRLLMRRAMRAAAAGPPLSTAARIAPSMLARANANANWNARLFSAAPANQPIASEIASPEADAQSYEKLVEESIKKLMSETNQSNNNTPDNNEQLKPISNEDLEVRLQYFQKVFEEAELCLSDLRDTLLHADDEQYREECACAEGALNNAFTAYIDLLEDFRRSSEDQLHAYSEERSTKAGDLKRLRKELDQIIEVANNRDRASR